LNEAEQNRLIIENMGLVAAVAADYRGRGVDFEDLLAIGREGLVIAARVYEPVPGAKFSTYAVHKIRSHIADEVKSGRHHRIGDEGVLEWGDEHSERVHEWSAWGDNGNARAIYETWPENFDGSPETLTVMFDEIRDKQERFQAAFISLKLRQRKLVQLVYLRDPPMSIEQAAREIGISYLKAWRGLKRSIEKMREVISAMENNEKPSAWAA
jgi:RNA polymerase sigma factor (sigma-70 family)